MDGINESMPTTTNASYSQVDVVLKDPKQITVGVIAAIIAVLLGSIVYLSVYWCYKHRKKTALIPISSLPVNELHISMPTVETVEATVEETEDVTDEKMPFIPNIDADAEESSVIISEKVSGSDHGSGEEFSVTFMTAKRDSCC